jgi:hypothetical protein
VVLRGCCGQRPRRPSPKLETLGMEVEYQLIDLATGVSYGGFRSLEAARQYAREEHLEAWDIFRGNVRVEYHDPR